tara:strand:+ start:1980 stop:2666 length:687 start_codon:yes stop_codon:yes gene_type:complete
MVLLSITIVTAIEITEVESNPFSSDSGTEWVELYSEEETNLDGYYLENNDGDIHELNQTFSSYLVIQFPQQWLDNSDERVFLKKNNETISSTDILEDSRNDDQSWNLCDNEWLFILSTKEAENDCEEDQEEPEDEEPEDEETEEEQEIEDKQNEEIEKSQNNQSQISLINLPSPSQEIILLNSPPSTESQPTNSQVLITKQEKIKLGIIIGFTILCVFIIILLALKKL